MKVTLRKAAQLLFVIFVFTAGAPSTALAKKTGRLRVEIIPYFGDSLLRTDRQYLTANRDTITISLFKFYLSRMYIGFENNASLLAEPPRLYDWDAPASWLFTLTPKNGLYNELFFNLGLDSAYNTSGANEGDLDPTKAMYWAWNSGYIHAKLEGISPSCATRHHAFEYHIGGYRSPYSTGRNIHFMLKQPITISDDSLCILTIKADVAAWFLGNFSVGKQPSILIPGKEASEMADRYQHMFSIISQRTCSNEGLLRQ